MRRHLLYGCVLDSDLELHLPESAATGSPDVILTGSGWPMDLDWSPCPSDVLVEIRDPEHRTGYVGARTRSGYRLRFQELCDFDISDDLGQVRWSLHRGGDPDLVAVLMVGALMSFRLILDGHLVLHASAVAARGRGLAFVGASGMGKSTMATLLCAGGAAMLTDDVARVDLDEAGSMIWPGGTESRLRPAAASLVQMFGTPDACRRTADGRTAVRLPGIDGSTAMPLNAVVVPLPSRQHQKLDLQQLDPAQAFLTLSSFPRLAGWVDIAVQDRQFHLLADLVDRVPVYRAIVPWGPPFDPATTVVLLDELGWTGPA